jgi:quercetin dioxygenase-like cupin family protein
MSIYFAIDPGVVVGKHSHPNEQMGLLIKGMMKWRIQGKETILKASALYWIPSQEPLQYLT